MHYIKLDMHLMSYFRYSIFVFAFGAFIISSDIFIRFASTFITFYILSVIFVLNNRWFSDQRNYFLFLRINWFWQFWLSCSVFFFCLRVTDFLNILWWWHLSLFNSLYPHHYCYAWVLHLLHCMCIETLVSLSCIWERICKWVKRVFSVQKIT